MMRAHGQHNPALLGITEDDFEPWRGKSVAAHQRENMDLSAPVAPLVRRVSLPKPKPKPEVKRRPAADHLKSHIKMRDVLETLVKDGSFPAEPLPVSCRSGDGSGDRIHGVLQQSACLLACSSEHLPPCPPCVRL